jgi:UDP-N-acetylmuramyl pentapeptide phosphotransferase/UDP-N-acetylglucosamine-1-phosphate transferase
MQRYVFQEKAKAAATKVRAAAVASANLIASAITTATTATAETATVSWRVHRNQGHRREAEHLDCHHHHHHQYLLGFERHEQHRHCLVIVDRD